MTLKDKTVIVTGAAAGIGRAITGSCLAEGATVIALDRDQEALGSLGEEFHSGRLHPHVADVTDLSSLRSLFHGLDGDFPGINALVNNAGIYLGISLLDYREDQIDDVISVNIKGALYCSLLFGKLITGRGGKGAIVNISSVAGQEASSDAVYGLTKAALLGLTRSCAMNFAPGIRVNAVAPTVVETAMTSVIPEDRLKHYREQELIKDPVLPEDVARTVVFLLSDAGRHYTGAVFDLNNGCYLR